MCKAIIKGRSDREVLQHHHGECRDIVKIQAYKHGKTRRRSAISIPQLPGIFKLILPLETDCVFSCADEKFQGA